MVGTPVTWQPPVLLTLRANQVQAAGEKDAAKEIVSEEEVTKDVADKAYASTAHNTHHRPETLREKLTILKRS